MPLRISQIFPAFLILDCLIACLPCQAAPPTPTIDRVAQGRRIYEQGILVSGGQLRGMRPGEITVQGADAACILCHRRSGMGLSEGASLVPAITGPALFGNARQAGHKTRLSPGITYSSYPSLSRPPYDAQSLGHAIRKGVSPSGYHFQYLMPKYELGDEDMAALIAYLRVLSARPSPGASEGVVHFSTVITPGQNEVKRKAMIDVLQACFAERHPSNQQWRLHVWDVKGAPETWGHQLEKLYAGQNVFALASGMGAGEWGPIHDFCESHGVPCMFPNVVLHGGENEGNYSFYFSRGALLEADVIAGYLGEDAGKNEVIRVVQISRSGGAGSKAAVALRSSLGSGALQIDNRILAGLSAEAFRKALEGLQATDTLVLWLDETELDALVKQVPEPPKAGMIFISGWLGVTENMPLNTHWRKRVMMVYPFDSPSRWQVRMNFNLRPWLKGKNIGSADDRQLGNTLTACNLLSEGMLRLRGVLSRDYLVELTENYPVSMGNAPGSQAFPRFSLGPGQRFSSKGAYVFRFAPDDKKLEVVRDWVIP